MGTEALHRRDFELAGEFIAGHNRADVHKTLIAVHHSAEVDVSLGIGKHGCEASLLDDHREGWWSDHIGVSRGLGGEHIGVHGIG